MNIIQPEWQISETPVDYPEALAAMQKRVDAIIAGEARELVWLLEHPPLYTAGTSAKLPDLLESRFPVYQAGRGGEYTYHGPGQRIAYVMLNLKARGMMDVRCYVRYLEKWIIAALAEFGVDGFVREGRVGVWVNTSPKSLAVSRPDEPSAREAARHVSGSSRDSGRIQKEEKIAALGIRIRKWVTFHGIAINVSPDLSHYAGIVPCGIREFGVTSLDALGVKSSMTDVDHALQRTFATAFAQPITACG
jgi:lipoyl(octanoyl) transferase